MLYNVKKYVILVYYVNSRPVEHAFTACIHLSFIVWMLSFIVNLRFYCINNACSISDACHIVL